MNVRRHQWFPLSIRDEFGQAILTGILQSGKSGASVYEQTDALSHQICMGIYIKIFPL
jgi:hypothetical protein